MCRIVQVIVISRMWHVKLYRRIFDLFSTTIKTTPAMEAGVTTYLWSMEDIVMMADTTPMSSW